MEDIEIEIKWGLIMDHVSKTFGKVDDLKDLVFLIGVQELGKGYQRFTKNQKVDLMHIGVCRLLSTYGYYEYEGQDAEGWPHYKEKETLPGLREDEKIYLLKRAIIEYFGIG